MPPLNQFRHLRCPLTGETLERRGDALVSASGQSYPLSPDGIPLFAQSVISREGARQQEHYDQLAQTFIENLGYPHTQEYIGYMDRVLQDTVGHDSLGDMVEICCGRGEALDIFPRRFESAIEVDVSLAMLCAARARHGDENIQFIQGDATRLPLASDIADTVVILGGIHHVPDRQRLFSEVARILKPGGRFIFREPVSDFFLWRWLRSIIYRVSPHLDHATERPLESAQTLPPLRQAGLEIKTWRTIGFLGFCLLMNSDVLVVNRLFRFVPGIRAITRGFTAFDDKITTMRPFRNAGLIVVGEAVKPAS
jgi:SAM-dependent methyltransferase